MIKTATESKAKKKELLANSRKEAARVQRKQEAADHPALTKPVYK